MKKICGTKMVSKAKKSFTLIEVILALIIAAMMSAYAIKTMLHNEFNKDITELQETIKMIIEDGIVNSEFGYASTLDGNCGSNFDVVDLNTSRLYYCNDWNSTFFLENDRITGYKDVNGSRINLGTGTLLSNYGGCNVRTSVDLLNIDGNISVVDNPRKFYIYIDCQNDDNFDINDLNNSEDRRIRAKLEGAIKFTLERDIKIDWLQTDDVATGMILDTTTSANKAQGGSDDDARIGAWFEL